VAVILFKNDRVLLGERLNSHGSGTWAFPGGHLELNESIEACARREVYEETGLYIKNIQKAAFTNDIFHDEKKHYVTLFIRAEYDSGQLQLKEPEKCKQWKWFKWNDFPEPLFLSLENLLKQEFNPDSF
jgi:8-oxo-dGTP diphosphatase